MLTFFARRMSERFHLVFGDCFVRQVLNIIPKENGTYRVLFAGQTNAAVVQEIKTCLEQPAVQMVGIRVNYHYAANKAHSILWVLNKVKKTIELYDPLGAESFITMIPDYRRIFKTIIKRNQWPILKYTFSAITTTNPARGLQAYEHDVPSCHDIGGFCETWTFYYAELRARNVNESPKQFKLKMERRLATITAAGINLGEYLKNIILHYLLDATPTTPTTT